MRIEGTPKEFADLVLAIRGQREKETIYDSSGLQDGSKWFVPMDKSRMVDGG